MPRRQTSWFPQRGWCLRLSWPGTPVTSFRWGRVATIAVSPGGAAGPARRDAPRRSSGIPSVRTAVPGSVAEAPPPTTGTFHAAGCVSFRAGAFDAVGDSIPVPGRAGCPRAYRNVPARAGCPQPRHPSAGRPWQPESLVQRVRRRRRRTTTSGPHRRARSDQAGEGTDTPRDARVRQAGAAGPHRSGWLTPIPAARRVRRGPPGAPGYGHRPAPAHCAGGP